MGCLHVNQTKCFMMMIASFMDLHSNHTLCLHGIHTRVYTVALFTKTASVYTIHHGKEPWSTRYQAGYFESRISSSKTVYLGFQD